VIRVIGILALVGMLYWLGLQWSNPRKRSLLLFIGTGVALAGLALTGKLSAAFAAIGALLAAVLRYWPVLLQMTPLLRRYWRRRDEDTPGASGGFGAMTREQALKILGLEDGADQQAIVQAHRRLIAKLHPDAGGSNYLAAQINLAKKFLLKS
jgi:hypothetical protein